MRQVTEGPSGVHPNDRRNAIGSFPVRDDQVTREDSATLRAGRFESPHRAARPVPVVLHLHVADHVGVEEAQRRDLLALPATRLPAVPHRLRLLRGLDQGPAMRWHRGHRPEQLTLMAQHREISDRLANVGEHHRQVHRDLARSCPRSRRRSAASASPIAADRPVTSARSASGREQRPAVPCVRTPYRGPVHPQGRRPDR